MLTSLTLTDFKSFRQAELTFGPITTIIGANAAGKSNLRDALKFLHAVGRGMTLPEIFGGKSSHGWAGIRGGAPGTIREGASQFILKLKAELEVEGQIRELCYVVAVSANGTGPLIVKETLQAGGFFGKMLFDTHPDSKPETIAPAQGRPKILTPRLVEGGDMRKDRSHSFPAYQPMLSQITEAAATRTDAGVALLIACVAALRKFLSGFRFIEFDPKALRLPSVPGAKTISESGDNLSSVLRFLVEDEAKGGALASWIKALTPMDVTGFQFEDYPDGKMLAVLVEAGGRRVPLSNASDGTLRFLGLLAAVLSPEAPSLLCFEEIETGLHPVRVQLVTELLQAHAQVGRPQVLLTTHSPQLLSCLDREHRKTAFLAYRVEGHPETRLKAFAAIPNLEEVLAKTEAARLLESGWFEDAMFFAEGEPKPVEFAAESDGEATP